MSMESKPNILVTSKYIGEISGTESYRKQRSLKLGKGSIRLAVDAGAAELAATHTTPETKYRSSEGDVYNVIAHISDFADGLREIDKLRFTEATREQKIPHLKKIIEFNHGVKDLIDNTPSLDFDDAINFITQIYSASHASDWNTREQRAAATDWFHNEARYRIDGMRDEIGAEQIIGSMADIEILYNDNATIDELIQDDLDGVDIRLRVDDTILGLDIKGSKAGVEKKKLKNSTTGHLAIWSQLNSRDFMHNGKNGFRLTPAKVAEKKHGLRAAIMQARDDELRIQQQRQRRRA